MNYIKIEYNTERVLVNWNDYWKGTVPPEVISKMNSKQSSFPRDKFARISNTGDTVLVVNDDDTTFECAIAPIATMPDVLVIDEIKDTGGVVVGIATIQALYDAIDAMIKI